MNQNTDESTTEDVIVVVEDNNTAPATTEQDVVVEDTTQNAPTTPADGGQDGKSVGRVIADLGNKAKDFAASTVSLAKSSEASRQSVKTMLETDPQKAKYVKDKFPDDYGFIMGEKQAPAQTTDVDLEKIREEERAKARVEVLNEQFAEAKSSMIHGKAQELGFNTEEFESFKKYTERLGGDEQAMTEAAILVNNDKVRAQSSTTEYTPQGGGQAPKPAKREVKISKAMEIHASMNGLDVQDLANDIAKIERLSDGNTLILPGL